MIPTVEMCVDYAAFLLGNENKSRFQTASLVKAVQLAYQEMVTDMIVRGVNTVELKTLFQLPANQPTMKPGDPNPTGPNIQNFGNLILLRERPYGSAIPFQFMTGPVETLPFFAPGGYIRFFKYSNSTFEWSPVANAVELEITYQASGSLPDSGTLGIDNCLVVVSKLAAAIAGPPKGLTQLGATLRAEVTLGDGDMHKLVQSIQRAEHTEPVQRGAYTPGGGRRSFPGVPWITN